MSTDEYRTTTSGVSGDDAYDTFHLDEELKSLGANGAEFLRPMDPSEADRILQSAGYDPLEVGERLKRFADSLLGQFGAETVLETGKAKYTILELLNVGRTSETYLAKSIAQGSDNAVPIDVIVKIPRLGDAAGDLEEAMQRAARFDSIAIGEFASMDRLKGLRCAAQVLDFSTYQWNLSGCRASIPVAFMIQEFISGNPLRRHLARKYYRLEADGFAGVPSAVEFFVWARKLTLALRSIHQRQVVHGDICPNNIRITDGETLVFIDFGQAVFQEMSIDQNRRRYRDEPYQTPEGARSVSGDIYSLGGVFYFLATGQDPVGLHSGDINEVKQRVIDGMQRHNPELYSENCGIADIIARCLRDTRKGRRIAHTDGALQDLDTFSPLHGQGEGVGQAKERVDRAIATLCGSADSVYALLGAAKLQSLAGTLEQMVGGTWDLVGDHEEIVSTLSLWLSYLRRGDMYITISDTRFWEERNAGENGRFMSMNRLAAERGVTLRRLFMLEQEGGGLDETVKAILMKQQETVRALEAAGKVQTGARSLGAGGFFTGILELDPMRRKNLLRYQGHYGAIIRGGEGMLMYPLYQEDGLMVAVQFNAKVNVRKLLKQFEALLDDAKPISELVFPEVVETSTNPNRHRAA